MVMCLASLAYSLANLTHLPIEAISESKLYGLAEIKKSENTCAQKNVLLIRDPDLVHAERPTIFNLLRFGGDGIFNARTAEEVVFRARRH